MTNLHHMLAHRFREDLELAKKFGCTAFRFSFEWARIEPERGRYDQDAIKRYAWASMMCFSASLLGLAGR